MRFLRSLQSRLWLLSRLGWYLVSLFGITLAPAIVVWKLTRPEGGPVLALALSAAAFAVGPWIIHELSVHSGDLPKKEVRSLAWGFTIIGVVVLFWLIMS